MNGRDIAVIAVVFIVAVMMPISAGIVARLLRGSARAAPPMADPMANARLERLEQAMDAIAIEIERISEGQRFVTKVLTERPLQTGVERPTMRQSITPH